MCVCMCVCVCERVSVWCVCVSECVCIIRSEMSEGLSKRPSREREGDDH